MFIDFIVHVSRTKTINTKYYIKQRLPNLGDEEQKKRIKINIQIAH